MRRWQQLAVQTAVSIALFVLVAALAPDHASPNSDNIPPDALLVIKLNCVAAVEEERVIEWSDGRQEKQVDYTARAEATYSDERPSWKLLLSKRTAAADNPKDLERSLIKTARDCADWTNAVKREQEKLRVKEKKVKK